MSLYYPGYGEALANVLGMDLDELLKLIDDLYGRDNLRYADDLEAVRDEALRQLEEEFTDRSSPEYDRKQSLILLVKAMRTSL